MEWCTYLQIIPIFIITYYYFKQKFSYWSSLGVNGPTPIPLIGTFWKSLIAGQAQTELEWSKQYGKVYGIYTGMKPSLLISDNELIKQVLVKDFHLFMNRTTYEEVHSIWKRNLFQIEGDDWKRIRTITSPSFSSGKLKSMYPLMNKCVEKLVDYFEQMTNESGVIDAKEVVAGFTVDVIASTSFGVDTNANDNRVKRNPFVHHGLNLANLRPSRISLTLLAPTIVRKFLTEPVIFPPESFEFLVSLAKQVIQNRRTNKEAKRNDLIQLMMDAYVSENEYQQSNYDQLAASDEKDYISNETKSKSDSKTVKTLDDNEIIAQCILFFLAGFETTASTLAHCLYELSMNPDIQDRLKEELKHSLNSLNTNSSEYYEAVMNQNPYLDSVIKETLRKYPPLVRLQRLVGVDGYKLAGIPLEKNQTVEISAYAVHYSPDYYPDPERFDPERFMPENKHLLVPYTFLSFGQGPRNCVGMRFAFQELKLCLARIVQQYRFSPTADTPKKLAFPNVGMLSAHKFPLKVTKREMS